MDDHKCHLRTLIAVLQCPSSETNPARGFLSLTTSGADAINPSRPGTRFALMRYVLSIAGTPQHHINDTREKWTGDAINPHLECHY